jgi:hypothetical protein
MIIVKPPMAPTRADLFLAGGISNCPDWQAEAELALADLPGLVHNPRRPGVLIADEAVAQIEWEHEALANSDTILFWFPKETLCPIALFELGVWSAKGAPLVVGVHPGYARLLDVVTQLRLARPDVIIHDNLDAVLNEYRTDMTS